MSALGTTPSRSLWAPVGTVIALGALAVSVALFCLVITAQPGRFWTTQDFAVYYAYGTALLDGGSLYELAPGTVMPFTYPPFAAWVLSPFSLLPYAWAARAMLALSLVALCALTWVAAGAIGLRGAARVGLAAGAAALALWTEPTQFTLMLGQVNLYLVLLVTADLSRPQGAWLRGVGVGIAAGFKLTPGLFLVYLALTRQWRTLGYATGAFAATVGIGAVLSPKDSLAYWSSGFAGASIEGVTPGAFSANQSLRGLVVRTLASDGGQEVTMAWAAVALVALMIGLFAAARAHRNGDELLALSAVGLTTLLLSPVSWSHHWVWTVVVLIALVGAAARRGAFTRVSVALLITGLLAVLATYPSYRSGVYQPTGITWLPPWNPFPDGDRPEFDWSPIQQLEGNAYVLMGAALLVFVAALPRSRRRVGTSAGEVTALSARSERFAVRR